MPKPEIQPRHRRISRQEELKRRYGLSLIVFMIWGASMMLGCCITGVIVRHNTEKELCQEYAIEYASQLEAYKRQQAEQVQAEHWLSGDASREAAINQAIDAVAPVIAKLNTDSQKLTEAACMLARVMSPLFPDSFQEVAGQEAQWMFYDGTDNTCTEHDRALAEQIIRPYMENGTIPNGLTAQMVYGAWSPNDYTLRDKYEATGYKTWSYSN
jgi:hypothetical protein